MLTDRSTPADGRLRRIAPLAAGALLCGLAAAGAQAYSGSAALAVCIYVAGGGALLALSERSTQDATAHLDALRRALQGLARGGDARLPRENDPALGATAAAFDAVRDALARTAARVVELSQRLEHLPDEVSAMLSQVERGAGEQEAAVEETASLFADINNRVRGINQEVENLARSNEETTASIQQMGTAIEQVAQSAVSLRESVESSTESIHEMRASTVRVAESSDEVQQVAEETAAATTQMDRAIQEVGQHVRGASELTRSVSERADEGSQAVGATINGIERIREQTLGAKNALEGLAERIREIGQIATVIGSISDETNLLSLNAAIIAAQAGDHGRAFAVVADQVKTLSQRTNASAKQIGEMIRAVQDESTHAVSAMAAGIESVEDGVQRSQFAGGALEGIRSAASEASGQVAEISRATEEQARNSKHVAGAAQRVSEHMQHISGAMGEQAGAAENLLRNANSYLEMCRQMAQVLEEQRATGRYITANSQSITRMIGSIQSNTASHERASAQVAERFGTLLDNVQQSAQRLPELTTAVADLRAEAEAARGAVARFGSIRKQTRDPVGTRPHGVAEASDDT